MRHFAGTIALGLAVSLGFNFSADAKPKRKHKTDVESEEVAAAIDEGLKRSSSIWFPDWGTPDFNWGLGPIIGAKYQDQKTEGYRERTVQSELGISAMVQGIPVIPGNAGLYLRPHGGIVWGRVDGKYDYDDPAKKDGDFECKYRRFWVGNDFVILAGWYRHTFGLTYGRSFWDENEPDNITSYNIDNDFGVLFLSWFSTHYTVGYLRANWEGDHVPITTQIDHWLHARMFFSLADFHIDIGPGLTQSKERLKQLTDETVSGRTDYIKLLAGVNPFWKLEASVAAKYVYDSTNKNVGTNAGTKLPQEGLYDQPSVAMPKDSLYTVVFLGARRIFAGLGVGYQINQQTLNMSEKNGTKRETTTDQGVIVTYDIVL